MCGIAIVKISNILFKNWLKTYIIGWSTTTSKQNFCEERSYKSTSYGNLKCGHPIFKVSKFRVCKTYTCKDKLNIPKIKCVCHRSIKVHLF